MKIEEKLREMFSFLDANKKVIEEDNGDSKNEVYDE